jgi:Protein of unknown function (DUF1572)
MTVPATPSRPAEVAALLMGSFRHVHDLVRAELVDLDDEGLNGVPVTGANSVAVIVRHLLGSEAETLRAVAGLPCRRDRNAEFLGPPTDMAGLEAMVDAADSLLATWSQ